MDHQEEITPVVPEVDEKKQKRLDQLRAARERKSVLKRKREEEFHNMKNLVEKLVAEKEQITQITEKTEIPEIPEVNEQTTTPVVVTKKEPDLIHMSETDDNKMDEYSFADEFKSQIFKSMLGACIGVGSWYIGKTYGPRVTVEEPIKRQKSSHPYSRPAQQMMTKKKSHLYRCCRFKITI